MLRLSTRNFNAMLKKHIFIKRQSVRNLLNAAAIQKRQWKSVVGLEIHAQIASESKLFSGSSTKFGSPLNSAVSFFDASLPGTLPVLNRKCVEYGVLTALALGCNVNPVSMFDRKHYFYADMPAGYQITQQRAALANNGKLTYPVIVPGKKIYQKTVRLLQLQLEQDSGKTIHDEKLKRDLIDLNRAGLPLMELVFAPDLENGEEAASLVKELILILRRLQTCSCKMEEGALRVDANISVHREGEPLGVRTEVKNISSVRGISQAITFEIERQMALVLNGGAVINETRAWDAESKQTITMRDKEVLQDYRFMPEPNLLPLRLEMKDLENPSLISVPKILKSLPELPAETRNKLRDTYAISPDAAAILVNESKLLEYFSNIMEKLSVTSAKLVGNFLINDFLTFINKTKSSIDECQFSEKNLFEIIDNLQSESINLKTARRLLQMIHDDPSTDIATLIKVNNLAQISDLKEIDQFCKLAMENQSSAVKQYKKGKQKAFFAIVGEVAKLSHQKANMKAVVNRLETLLKDSNK